MNRMKQLREERNLTMKEASVQLGLPYTTYINYEKGYREPNSETLISIAEFYDTSIDYLLCKSNSTQKNGTSSLQHPKISQDVVSFPVMGTIAAGYDELAVEDWSGETVEIPSSYLKGRSHDEFFVLSVDGDSMYPLYHSGDKVLILKQETLNNSGDIGAVLYDGELATIKKIEFVSGEDWMRFVPVNPNYPPKTITGADLERCRIIGIPKLLIRNL